MELIKATIKPDSWDKGGATIVPVPEHLGIVVRQTEETLDKISTLLLHLRKSQDQNVQITSLLVKLTTEEQLKGIEDQYTLHPLSRGRKWMLLTPQRSVALKNWFLEQKPEIISSPKIMTISGQSAMLIHGSFNQNVFTGSSKMTVTPQLVADSPIIRLTYTFSIDSDRPPKKTKSLVALSGNSKGTISGPEHEFGTIRHESLVGSGQTLLLLIEQPRPNDAAKSVDRYVLMMTPEHVVDEK